jgi:hypothetical protein
MPETKDIDNNKVMKEQFQNLTKALRQQGADLAETPAVFKWEYPDEPHVMYQLVIVELTEETKAFIEEDASTLH